VHTYGGYSVGPGRLIRTSVTRLAIPAVMWSVEKLSFFFFLTTQELLKVAKSMLRQTRRVSAYSTVSHGQSVSRATGRQPQPVVLAMPHRIHDGQRRAHGAPPPGPAAARSTRFGKSDLYMHLAGLGWSVPLRACSVIFNPYGLEGIDTNWGRF
jgi:hypothetical protein